MKTTLKRLTALILVLSMALSLFSTGAWAADQSEDTSPVAVQSEEEPQAEPEEEAEESEPESEPEEEPESEPEEEPESEPEEEPEAPAEDESEPEEAEAEESARNEPGMNLTAMASNVAYLDADGRTNSAATATEVTSDSTTWNTGWYVVSGNVTITSRVTVSGTVNLILADGANLNASKGIKVEDGNSLTIYAQSEGDNMGKLSATGGDYDEAGIGGGSMGEGGTITISGGEVTATGGAGTYSGGAGIGGGGYCACGTITISGGTVTATGGDAVNADDGGEGGAGIGCGGSGSGGTITISDGAGLIVEAGSDAASATIVTDVSAWTHTEKYAHIYATASLTDLNIILPDNLTGGTVTAAVGGQETTTANFKDTVTLTVTPESGYSVASVKVTGAAATLSGVDANGVRTYTMTMPAKDVSVAVSFGTPVTYTVFYKATDSPGAVRFRLSGDDETGIELGGNTYLGNTVVWAYTLQAADGSEMIPVSFRQDSGNWSALTERSVSALTDTATLGASLSAGEAVIVRGDVFTVTFVYDDGSTQSHAVPVNGTVSQPTAPTKTGYTFQRWERDSSDNPQYQGTAYNFSSPVTESFILFSVFTKSTYTVSFDSGVSAQNVSYLGTATKPADPAGDAAHAFQRWVLADTVHTVNKEGTPVILSKDTEYDFSTPVTSDVKLKAVYAHQHDYTAKKFEAAISDYDSSLDEYNKALHTLSCPCDDWTLESHTFDNGKC